MGDDVEHPEDPDGASPWLNDDWIAEPVEFGPWVTEASPGVVDARPSDDHDDDELPPHAGRPRRIAFGVVAALGAIFVALRLVGGPSPAEDPIPVSDSTVDVPDVSERPTETSTPADVTTAAPTSTPVQLIGDGDEIEWVESTIVVPDAVSSMVEPTEVVVATVDRLLHRIELPSGRVRTLDLSRLGADVSMVGAAPQVYVGADSLVVVRGTDVAVLRDGQPMVAIEVPGGAHVVQPRAGTADFVVTGSSPSDGSTETRWILHPDGTLGAAPAPIADVEFWETTFLPSGSLVLNRPGGVYKVADDGSAERISSGVLIATGVDHYLVQMCTETLQCQYVSTEEATGEAAHWESDPSVLDIAGDVGSRLSPDGQALLYFDYSGSGPGRQRVLDLITGESFDAGLIDQLVWDEIWATDSSGAFLKEDGKLRFVTRTGKTAVFDLDGAITSVATRPPPNG